MSDHLKSANELLDAAHLDDGAPWPVTDLLLAAIAHALIALAQPAPEEAT